MSSSRISQFVPQPGAIGSALELALAAAIAALMAMMLASPLLPAGAAAAPASAGSARTAGVTYVTLPTVVVVGRSEAGTTTLADLDVVKAAPNQVNLAQ